MRFSIGKVVLKAGEKVMVIVGDQLESLTVSHDAKVIHWRVQTRRFSIDAWIDRLYTSEEGDEDAVQN